LLEILQAVRELAWWFPDETSDYADGVLVALVGKTILVPAVLISIAEGKTDGGDQRAIRRTSTSQESRVERALRRILAQS
jgi:hypothetical protein